MASDQALAADKVVRSLKSFTSLLSQPQAQPEFRSLQVYLLLAANLGEESGYGACLHLVLIFAPQS